MSSLSPLSYKGVIIGLDPHPGSHTAVALDQQGRSLEHVAITNDPDGEERLLAWAVQFPARRWAIEGAGNSFVAGLVARLLAQGEEVTNIPPSFTSQYRSRRGRKKNDLIDAENVARVLMANPTLPAYAPGQYQAKLQELSRTHHRLARQLKANRMALAETTLPEVRQALACVITALEEALKDLRRSMEELVNKAAPELLKLFGVGPVIAATLLAEIGDVRRFANRDGFAMYGGCAPVMRAQVIVTQCVSILLGTVG